MTNDSAIVRLLYAILKQKCLKDVSTPAAFLTTQLLIEISKNQINWNEVAADPILQEQITNGHAARMRYSRFKKQMDNPGAPPTPRKPRNPNSPRKTKVEKNKFPKKVKDRKESDDAGKLKEEVGVAGLSHRTPVEGTPEAGIQLSSLAGSPYHGSVEGSSFLKREPGSSSGSRYPSEYPSTPLEESNTPASSFDGAGEVSDMDDMMALHSFEMQGGEYMTEAMTAPSVIGQQQYGMGMHMGMGDPFQSWELHQPQIQAEDEVPVKMEPKWEQNYHRV